MIYLVIEEASEATVLHTKNLEEAIKECESMSGEYYIVDSNDNLLYTKSNLSYKI